MRRLTSSCSITAYTHATCWWKLSWFQETFFCSTNKDSIKKKPFKSIRFLIWVEKIKDEKHIALRYLISNFERYLFWELVWPKTKVKWFFFNVKKINRVVFPIDFLQKQNSSVISLKTLRRVLRQLLSDFWWLLQVLSILENFSSIKNQTSNGSKPIGDLTHTISLHSDERLSIGYSLPDLQSHRSNFVIHFSFFTHLS